MLKICKNKFGSYINLLYLCRGYSGQKYRRGNGDVLVVY